MIARCGRLLGAWNGNDSIRFDPGNHLGEQLCRPTHSLRDCDLRRLRFELLDPASQGTHVRDSEAPNGCALEVMPALAGFDEENPGPGPDDRDRETGKPCTRAEIDEGLSAAGKKEGERERLQNEATRDLVCGSVAGQIDPLVPALEDVGEEEQLLLLALGDLKPELSEARDQNLARISQTDSE